MSAEYPFMRPIDSAPRDGTPIIVGDPDAGWFPMHWGHIQRNEFFAPGVTGMWVMTGGGTTWTEHDGFGPSEWCFVDEWAHHFAAARSDERSAAA